MITLAPVTALDGRPRIVSLWDMLKFAAPAFVNAVEKLADMKARIEAAQFSGLPLNAPLIPSNVTGTVKQIDAAMSALQELPLPLTRMSLSRLRTRCLRQPPVTFHDVRLALADVAGRMEDELAGQEFFSVAPSHEAFYATAKNPLCGANVAAAFPSASFDLGEAGRCFALDRYTACVMHLMRALETPLEVMAKAVGVTSHDNWNKLLNDIEAAARARTKAEHGPEEEQWFQEAASHLRLIKNAWRNHAMHKRETYGENDARELISHVGAVLRHLATRLSE